MFKHILLPIDLQETELTKKALQVAVNEARTYDATLHVLVVVPGFGMPIVSSFVSEDAMNDALKRVAKELKRYVAKHFPDDIKVVPLITEGNPYERILKMAKKTEADLIVIPSHNQGFNQVFLGAIATKVVEYAHCTVVIVKT